MVHLCGPVPFMCAVRGDLLRRGVPAEAGRYEVFGPDLWLGQRQRPGTRLRASGGAVPPGAVRPPRSRRC